MRSVMRGLFSRGLRGGFEGWVAWESGCKAVVPTSRTKSLAEGVGLAW
jgi:hypothetical protein